MGPTKNYTFSPKVLSSNSWKLEEEVSDRQEIHQGGGLGVYSADFLQAEMCGLAAHLSQR